MSEETMEPGWGWLPAWLRPLREERDGRGSRRLIETTLLVLAGVVLATATVSDVVRQAHINDRLIADLKTWRHYTGHDYRNISTDQELLGISSKRDVACGNTSPGAPKTKTQICLVLTGPTVAGRRHVAGGWYLRANSENDVVEDRYGCFGAVTEGLCPR